MASRFCKEKSVKLFRYMGAEQGSESCLMEALPDVKISPQPWWESLEDIVLFLEIALEFCSFCWLSVSFLVVGFLWAGMVVFPATGWCSVLNLNSLCCKLNVWSFK